MPIEKFKDARAKEIVDCGARRKERIKRNILM